MAQRGQLLEVSADCRMSQGSQLNAWKPVILTLVFFNERQSILWYYIFHSVPENRIIEILQQREEEGSIVQVR